MLVYYAGWCDKYQQVFSCVNPVESSDFNFSFPEPTGVVSAILMLIYKESRNSIIDDYMKSLDNIKVIFEKYSKEFPDINTDIIYPKREFIESFLDNVNLNNII